LMHFVDHGERKREREMIFPWKASFSSGISHCHVWLTEGNSQTNIQQNYWFHQDKMVEWWDVTVVLGGKEWESCDYELDITWYNHIEWVNITLYVYIYIFSYICMSICMMPYVLLHIWVAYEALVNHLLGQCRGINRLRAHEVGT
jgi:hypothetical protein